MRKLLFPLAAAAALAGCGLVSAPPSGPAAVAAPMHARIFGTGLGRIQFSVDRPAYVAVFEMIPGGGVRVVYPEFNTDGRFVTAGSYSMRDQRWRPEYAGYFPSHFAGLQSSYGSPYGGTMRWEAPRYFYLIASRAPLAVSPYVNSSHRLRNALGWQAFASQNPYQAMDAVAELILTDATPGSWTSDVYVDWPEPAPPVMLYTAPAMRVVPCADGSQILVPVNSGVYRCPSDPVTQPNPPATPADSVEARKPQRRRPEAPRGTEPPAATERARPTRPAAPPREPVQRPEVERPRPLRPQPEQVRAEPRVRAAEPPRAPARPEPQPAPRSAEPPSRPAAEPPATRPAPERPAAEPPVSARPAAERPTSVRPDTR